MLKLFVNNNISLNELKEMLENATKNERFGDCVLLRDLINNELYFDNINSQHVSNDINSDDNEDDNDFNYMVLEETINTLIESATNFIESFNNIDFGEHNIKESMSDNLQKLYNDIKELKIMYYNSLIKKIKSNHIKFSDKNINKRYKNKKNLIIKSLKNELFNIQNDILGYV